MTQPAGLLVLDVSYAQGPIDWPRVKAAGVSGVYVKVADGVDEDRRYAMHRKGIEAAGLDCGAYLYSYARHSASVLATTFWRLCGEGLTLPPMFDFETTDGASPEVLRAHVLEWLAGVPGSLVYTYPTFWNEHVKGENVPAPLVIAHYGVPKPTVPCGWTDWALWQWTNAFRVDGSPAPVDCSVFRGSIEELRALGKPRLADTEPAPPLNPMELEDR